MRDKPDHPTTPTKKSRTSRIVLNIVNLLFPVKDAWRLVTTAPRPLVMTLDRTRKLFARQKEQSKEELGWERAVNASGLSVPELERRFRLRQILWRGLMAGAAMLTVSVVISTLVFFDDLPWFALLRGVAFILMLTVLIAVCFVKAMEATYRRWQLCNRRVSTAEHGTFADYAQEHHWVWETLGLGNITKNRMR